MSSYNNDNNKKNKAIILVGGFGTRLRPLTFTTPKPCIEFCGKPFIYWMIRGLILYGNVNEIIFASCHQSEIIKNIVTSLFVDQINNPKGSETKIPKLTFIEEKVPLGTAGAIHNCRTLIGNCEHFFVFNSDVTCRYDIVIKNLLDLDSSKIGNIAGFKVEDPTKYGVLCLSNPKDKTNNEIKAFIEKPKDSSCGNIINGGLYFFHSDILNFILDDNHKYQMLEKDVFPVLAKHHLLDASFADSFWMDIGQPKDYLLGQSLFMSSNQTLIDELNLARNLSFKNNQTNETKGNTFLNSEIKQVGNYNKFENCSVFKGCIIGNGISIKNSIIGENCIIQDNVIIENSILGNSITVFSSNIILNAKIAPFKEIKTHCISINEIKDYM